MALGEGLCLVLLRKRLAVAQRPLQQPLYLHPSDTPAALGGKRGLAAAKVARRATSLP